MHKRINVLIVAGTVLGLAEASPPHSDPHFARNLAATCSSCHGDGMRLDGIPSLTGQKKEDLVRKLKDFKAGTMPGTIMPQLAKGYTDDQLDAIAGWLAAQKAK